MWTQKWKFTLKFPIFQNSQTKNFQDNASKSLAVTQKYRQASWYNFQDDRPIIWIQDISLWKSKFLCGEDLSIFTFSNNFSGILLSCKVVQKIIWPITETGLLNFFPNSGMSISENHFRVFNLDCCSSSHLTVVSLMIIFDECPGEKVENL